MANQNLSQFTEKTFVADADHTFIWDTAASISKRVSRNSWLNSGTLTSDAPVTISQTWNNAAVAFTGLKVNAVSTASSDYSLLLDLQLGGSSKVQVYKAGWISLGSSTAGYVLTNGTTRVSAWGNNNGGGIGGLGLASSFVLGWSSGADGGNFGTLDTILLRDGAANTLALRNGANAQTFRVYNTYTDASNYERGTITWESNELNIRSEKAGSGQLRNIVINAGLGLKFYFNNSTIGFQYTQSGHLLYFTDNSQDIGASGASRPRNVYVGTAIAAGGGISGQNFGSSAGGYFNWATRSNIFSPADGVIRLANDAQTDFNRLQFGGTTNLFPAIKRSTTYLQARLADDSAFAPIQGKLTTDTAYTATVVAATGYITIYDSTGTAYRVPCAV